MECVLRTKGTAGQCADHRSPASANGQLSPVKRGWLKPPAVRVNTTCHRNVVHPSVKRTLHRRRLCIKDSPQRHDRLIFRAIARSLLKRPPNSPTREQLGTVRDPGGTVRQRQLRSAGIAGQRSTTFWAARRRRWALEMAILRQQLRGSRTFWIRQAEGVLQHAGRRTPRTGATTDVWLARRTADPHHRQQRTRSDPRYLSADASRRRAVDILRYRRTPRIASSVPVTASVNVRPALADVGIRFNVAGQQFAARGQQRPVHRLRLAGEGADEWFFRQRQVKKRHRALR